MSSASPPTTFVFEEIQSNSRIHTPLAIFLEKLDAIPSSTIPSGFIRNTKLLHSLYAKKQQQLDSIVCDFASLYTIPINFNALFEQRMLACGNTLTKTQTEHYINVLDFYLQFKINNNENRVAAKQLLSYLESHLNDPDNSLIGLTPNKSVLENLNNVIEDDKTKIDTLLPPKVDGPFSAMFTSQDLIDMMLRWDEMSDDDAVICLHQFAASARNHGNPNSSSSLLGNSMTFTPSSANLLSSSGSLPPPSSPIPVSMHAFPKAVSSPALLRSPSSSSLSSSSSVGYVATPPGSPSRELRSSQASTSFSLFPGFFKKSVDKSLSDLKAIPYEKPAWKEGDVVVVFVGMVTDPNNKEVLLVAIKTARDEMNENAFMFARVSEPCIDHELNVGVYIDKNETKARVVSRESVFMLKFDQATPSMVCDISQPFFSKLSMKLADRTNLFLVSQGLDLTVLEQALINESSFFDIPALKHNISCVHNLQLLDNIVWTTFLDSVRTYSESRVKQFLADIELEGKIFPLSRKQIVSQLNRFDYASIPAARLQSYLSASQTAIDNLKLLENEMLDGTTKHKLSEWYLEHIKVKVDEFLTRHGFELDVIPENYIDQAPKDLALVGKNWAMSRDLIEIISSYSSKAQGHHEVIDVMTSLMDDIYTKLDEFVRDALFVISENLGVTRDLFDVAQNQDVYDEVVMLFEAHKAGLTEEMLDMLSELLKDVDYIFKIREMEGIQTGDRSRDHVPISGLIASRFFRLENELRTSLDIWDPERLDRNAQGNCAELDNTTNFDNTNLKVEAVQ